MTTGRKWSIGYANLIKKWVVVESSTSRLVAECSNQQDAIEIVNSHNQKIKDIENGPARS